MGLHLRGRGRRSYRSGGGQASPAARADRPGAAHLVASARGKGTSGVCGGRGWFLDETDFSVCVGTDDPSARLLAGPHVRRHQPPRPAEQLNRPRQHEADRYEDDEQPKDTKLHPGVRVPLVQERGDDEEHVGRRGKKDGDRKAPYVGAVEPVERPCLVAHNRRDMIRAATVTTDHAAVATYPQVLV